MSRVAVVGGGISGIASAYYLAQSGFEVDLYEAGSKIGGRIGSAEMLGRSFDFGGKNIGKKYHRFRDFIRSLGGCEFEEFGFNTSQSAGGRVIKLDKAQSPGIKLVKTLQMCGVKDTLKLLPYALAIARDRQQGFLNTTTFNLEADKKNDPSLADYFTEPCLSRFIRPLTVRMNGAEPEECHLGNFGSNLALVLDSYEQLCQGMELMLERFSESSSTVRILTGYSVSEILTNPASGLIEINALHQGNLESKTFDRVIVALPAVSAAKLFEHSAPVLVRLLNKVRYYPVAVAIAQYENDVFTADHRAMLFDTDSPLSNAGTYGINDLNIVRYTFSGGAARRLIPEKTPVSEVIGIAEHIAEPHFNIEKNRRLGEIYKYMNLGLCAYSPRHHHLLSAISEEINHHHGLSLTGDYWRGASIEACFSAAFEAVDRIN